LTNSSSNNSQLELFRLELKEPSLCYAMDIKILNKHDNIKQEENLTEKILQAEKGRKPMMKRQDAIDCT
jgi:hypothetical protein